MKLAWQVPRSFSGLHELGYWLILCGSLIFHGAFFCVFENQGRAAFLRTARQFVLNMHNSRHGQHWCIEAETTRRRFVVTRAYQPTHRKQRTVDESIGSNRYRDEGRTVPAEGLDVGDGDKGWYADDEPETLPGSDTHYLDEWREQDKLNHGHQEARGDEHLGAGDG